MSNRIKPKLSEAIQSKLSRRTIANRENAKRSTGPKTTEGKNASRRNALKHGMAAETLVADPYREEAEARVAGWERSLRPGSDFERDMVRIAANATTLLGHCQADASAVKRRSSDAAGTSWDLQRDTAAAKLGARIGRRPVEVAAQLRETIQGARWMIARWRELLMLLDAGKPWNDGERSLALSLLGVPLELRDGSTAVGLSAETPEEKHQRQLELARTEIEKLEQAAVNQLQPRDEADRALQQDHPIPALDPEIKLMMRYERALSGRVFQALREFRRERAERSDSSESERPPAPAPLVKLPVVPPPPPASPPVESIAPDPAEKERQEALYHQRIVDEIATMLEEDAREPYLPPGHRAKGIEMLEDLKRKGIVPTPRPPAG